MYVYEKILYNLMFPEIFGGGDAITPSVATSVFSNLCFVEPKGSVSRRQESRKKFGKILIN